MQGLQLQHELEVANDERDQLKADCVRLTQQLLPPANQFEEQEMLSELQTANMDLEEERASLEERSKADSRLIAQLQQKAYVLSVTSWCCNLVV